MEGAVSTRGALSSLSEGAWLSMASLTLKYMFFVSGHMSLISGYMFFMSKCVSCVFFVSVQVIFVFVQVFFVSMHVLCVYASISGVCEGAIGFVLACC